MDPYSFIPDLPKGPLDEYRDLAPKLSWKQLKVVLEGEDAVKIKYRTYKIMSSHPIFDKGKGTPTSDEQKKITAEQMMKIVDMDIFPPEIYSLTFKPRVS